MVLHQTVEETVQPLMEVMEEVRTVETQLEVQMVQTQEIVAGIQEAVLLEDLRHRKQHQANQK